MKYLLIFLFAGFFLADATDVVKYKLSLIPGDDRFQGKVTLTLSDRDNKNPVELDAFDSVTKCRYTGIKTPPTTTPTPTSPTSTSPTSTSSAPTSSAPTSSTSTSSAPTSSAPTSSTSNQHAQKHSHRDNEQTPELIDCIFQEGKIIFEHKRTSEEVVLEFRGTYSDDGLIMYKTESNERLYVADMTLANHKMIFPCKQDKEAEFELEGDNVMSNLEKLRGKSEDGKVSLRSIIFIQGDIVKDKTSVPSFPYYRMKSSKEMGPKLKSVMEKASKLDSSVQVLFTPVALKQFSSRDIIILRDVLNPQDSTSDYWVVAHDLTDKLFQRQANDIAFFTLVGPVFAALKILGGHTDIEELRHYLQIYGLERDAFNYSKSLNDIASESENVLLFPELLSKGISVLYSLESICGDDKFMKGLSNYIKDDTLTGQKAFEACFDSLDKATEFFNAWVYAPGYPVVHVILNKTAEYHMSQERFLWFGDKVKDQRWTLPVNYKTKEGACGNITLPATKDNVPLKVNSTYLTLNHDNKGFYRVNYDAKVWEALITQLKSNHKAIDPVSRTQLVDDVFSFPKSIYSFDHSTPDYVTALKLSDYLRNETDFFTLQVAFRAFHFLDSALNSSYHGKFRDHTRGILNGIYKSLTNATVQTDRDRILKNQVTIWACKFGVEECLKSAAKTFETIKWNSTLSRQEELAVCSVVRNNSTKWMESFASLPSTRPSLSQNINVLTCTRDETLLSLFITQFIQQENQRGFKQAVAAAMENNPDNTKVILNIVKRVKKTIMTLWGNECLGDIVKLALPRLNSESAGTLKEIAKDLDKDLEAEVNMVCENVKVWTDKKGKSVGDYFKGSGSQAKPIALVLLATTLIPLANHIFHN